MYEPNIQRGNRAEDGETLFFALKIYQSLLEGRWLARGERNLRMGCKSEFEDFEATGANIDTE